MAVFETMRENTKVVLWITVVAFVGLIFLAWGADWSSSRGGGNSSDAERGVLAKVNGERVMYNEYQDAMNEAWISYEQSTGSAPDDRTVLMLRSRVWQNLLEEALIRGEVKKAGISANDIEVANALANNPPPQFRSNPNFLTDGQFDLAKWQGFLVNTPDTRGFERQMYQQVTREKLQMRKLAAVKVSDAEVRESWLEQNEKAALSYAMISFYKMPAVEVVSDNLLSEYLSSHADEFTIPEQVVLEYIKIDKTITEQDSLDARAEITEAFNEHKRGENFRLLVMSYSNAQPARSGGEDAMFLTREQLTQPEVSDFAFGNEVGAVSEILLSADGYHVIKVEEKTTEEDVEKVKIAEIFVPLRMTETSNSVHRELALALADSTQQRQVGFADAAAGKDLVVNATPPFNPDAFIPGLGRITAAKEFAEKAANGDISKPVETFDAWYLFHLAERHDERAATLEDVRDRVQTAYQLEERKQLANTRAKALLAACQSGKSLEEAAQGDTLAVYNTAEGVTRLGYIRGLGSDPKITGSVFATAENGLIPYIIEGGQGTYVIEVTGREELDETLYEQAKTTLRNNLLREKQGRVINMWMDGLLETAEVVDYRIFKSSM
jgi:peptidyl-prolyl cis-trans isomerase D